MWSFLKDNFKYIIIVFITGIICGSVGVYGAVVYMASDFKFSASDSSFKSTNVDDALNELYDLNLNDFSDISYYTSAHVGKAQDSTGSALNFSLSLTKGKYLISMTRSAANASAFGSDRNSTSNYFNLSGCDNLNILDFEKYGQYTSATNSYINAFLNTYICEVKSSKSVSGYFATNTDDSNIIAVAFKLS